MKQICFAKALQGAEKVFAKLLSKLFYYNVK